MSWFHCLIKIHQMSRFHCLVKILININHRYKPTDIKDIKYQRDSGTECLKTPEHNTAFQMEMREGCLVVTAPSASSNELLGLSIKCLVQRYFQLSSVTQSCQTLQSNGLQQARLPCPSPIPGACSNPCPSSW